MKLVLSQPGDRCRFGLAVLAGGLLALSFPRVGLAGFAWLAPGLMLASAVGVDGRMAFRLGYVAGLVKNLISLSWLLHIPVNKLAPVTGWMALSGFLALYSAAWVWICWRIFPARTQEPAGTLTALLDPILAVGWLRRMSWALACAALWVAAEMGQARIFSGFPWNLLGASQYTMLPLIQIARFTGVYGVGFLVVWFSVSLLFAATVVLRKPENSRRWLGEIIVPLVAGLAIATIGMRQSFTAPAESSRRLKIALVQPSIPQRWIWNPAENSRRFEQLLALSERALATRPDLLVWPEAAAPGFLRWSTNLYAGVTGLARRHGTWMVIGSDDADPLSDPTRPDRYDVFNSSFLVSPAGELVASYRKRRLVMFGEFIPFTRWLPFLERWTGLGSFAAGKGPVAFPVPELRCKLSVLICFEDVFPHWAREHVEPDTDFLLNLTNNGWFGESSAQGQHAASAVFRAIENGLPLVRCTNNGLTCWVDARGQMHEVFFPGTKDIYGPGFKVVEVPLLDSPRVPTFYSRYGDVFGWTCVAWSALNVLRAFLRRNHAGGSSIPGAPVSQPEQK